jgi:hypothetical protein
MIIRRASYPSPDCPCKAPHSALWSRSDLPVPMDGNLPEPPYAPTRSFGGALWPSCASNPALSQWVQYSAILPPCKR